MRFISTALVFLSNMVMSYSQDSTNLSLRVNGMHDDKLVLLSKLGGYDVIDTIRLYSGAGSKHLLLDESNLYFLRIGDTGKVIYTHVFMQPNEDIAFEVDTAGSVSAIRGGDVAAAQFGFYSMARSPDFSQIQPGDKEEKYIKIRDWLQQNRDSPFSAVVIYFYWSEFDVSQIKALVASLSEKAKEKNAALRFLERELVKKERASY